MLWFYQLLRIRAPKGSILVFRLLCCLLICTLLSGCAALAPAPEPPQLRHTPGPAVVSDHEQFISDTLRLDYPDGWRIVRANTAAEPLRVFFVSPDNQQIIRVALAEPTDTLVLDEIESTIQYEEIASVAEQSVYLAGIAPATEAANFSRTFQAVRQSLRSSRIR